MLYRLSARIGDLVRRRMHANTRGRTKSTTAQTHAEVAFSPDRCGAVSIFGLRVTAFAEQGVV